MATWNSSKSFKCRNDHTSYTPGSFEELSWSYNTTCDSLVIEHKKPDRFCAYMGKKYEQEEEKSYYGQDEAKCLYRCLRDWIKVYCGDRDLARIDNEMA